MATLKDALGLRVQRLKADRDELATRRDKELAALDAQIAACLDLYTRFDSLTITEGLTALAKTGLSVKVE